MDATDPSPPRTPPSTEREGAPVAPGSRIATLDVVRGVAVLGILLVNVHLFRGLDVEGLLEDGGERVHGAADRWVEILTGTLATGTFLGLFSLLFGLGVGLQLSRRRGGRFGSARILVVKRMLWLLLIALAHRQFASVDILFGYSLLGLGLVILAGPYLPPRPAWARVLAGTGVVLLLVAGPLAANVAGPSIGEGFFRERTEVVQEALTAGSAMERLEARALEAVGSQGGRGFTLQVLGWMLMGFGIGSSGQSGHVLQVLRTPPPGLLGLGVAAMGTGVLLRLTMAVPLTDPAPFRSPDGVGGALGVAGSALLVTGLGMAVAGLAARAGPASGARLRLAAVGRMALTAYLLQSVLVEVAFLVPGAREAMGSAASLLLVGGAWAFLLVVCSWWMGRFRFGPVEWLWRSLTYLRPQPLRSSSPVRSGG